MVSNEKNKKKVDTLVISDTPQNVHSIGGMKHRSTEYIPDIFLSTSHVLSCLILLTSLVGKC